MKINSIRNGFAAAAIAVTALVFTSCGKKRADVIITYSRGGLCMAPLHVASVKGYFEEEFKKAGYSFSFEEVEPGTAYEVIGAGKSDASATLSASTILPIENGLDISFTGGLHTGCTKYFVKKDSPINSVKDLKGKKIGVISQGDSATINIKRILAENGIKVEGNQPDITVLFFAQSDLPLALENGAVDIVGMHDPAAYIAQKNYGFKTLIDTMTDDKFSSEYCCQCYVTNRLIQEKPKAAAAYTRAMLKGAAYVQAHPYETAKLQIENHYVEGDPELNGAVLAILNYNPGIDAAQQTVANIVNELKEIGLMKESTVSADFIKSHFTKLEGVPESYVYNEDGTFTEIWN